MKLKRTESFTPNIRLSTVPGLTQEEYDKLLADAVVDVGEEATEYLVKSGYATPADEQKKKGKQ